MSRTFLLASHQVKKGIRFFLVLCKTEAAYIFTGFASRRGGFDVAANKSDNSFSWIPHSDCSPRVAFPFPECYCDMMEVSLSRGTQSNVQSAVTGGLMWAFSYIQLPRGRRSHMRHWSSQAGTWIKLLQRQQLHLEKKQKKKTQVHPAKWHATSTKCTKKQSHECWRCLGPTTELIKPFRWPHQHHPLAKFLNNLSNPNLHSSTLRMCFVGSTFFSPPPPSSAAKSPHNRDSYGALFNIYGNRRISLRQQSLTAFSLPSMH